MARSFLPVLLLSALTNLAPALSESSEAARKELEAALNAEDDSKAQAGTTRSGRSTQSYLRTLNASLELEDRQQVTSMLDQISNAYNSPAASQALAKLQASLAADVRKQEDDFIAEAAAITKEISETIPKATKITDLDPLLEKIDALSRSRGNRQRSERVSNELENLRRLENFTSSWQDYLQALGTGQRTRANQLLRNLSGNESRLPVPRSLVISMIQEDTPEAAKANEPLPSITELDQIEPTLRKLRAISMNSRNSSSGIYPENLDQAIQSLATLDKTYQDFKAGLPTNLGLILRQDGSHFGNQADPAYTAALRVKLLLLVLPGYLGIPDEAAKPDEDIARYLDRVEKTSAEKGDAATCARVIETWVAFEPGAAGASAARSLLVAFRAGQAQEVAGQAFQAAVSYQNALAAGPSTALAGLIGKRLEEIKRSNPEEYKRASSIPASTRGKGRNDAE
ncbi:MAG: hypothetical protein EOP88_00255 [Verrucomicrobiaceae bacterium]|nr:MAG: hypothetical protein EOP88_00255 [Verrucomicrobiaceae bacterium]